MLIYKKGERREVSFIFKSNFGKQFTINSASYSIVDSSGNTTQGNATISDNKVFILFEALNTGMYYVNFTVSVDTEVYCPQEVIRVE